MHYFLWHAAAVTVVADEVSENYLLLKGSVIPLDGMLTELWWPIGSLFEFCGGTIST